MMEVKGSTAGGTMEVERELSNLVMCQLTDPEGTPLGTALFLPESTGPKELQQLVNKLLNNEEKSPYAFYVSDHELLVQLGSYLQKKKVSVEKVMTIVYQPQAVFRIRPVTRCSSTIAGHKNWILCIAWAPDGKHLVSGSKAGEILCWNPQTGESSGNPLVGHKKWITGISWEPLHLNAPCRHFVSASKDGDARIWDVSLKKCVICLTGHTLAITCVRWGGDGVIYTGYTPLTSDNMPFKVDMKPLFIFLENLRCTLLEHLCNWTNRTRMYERFNLLQVQCNSHLICRSQDCTIKMWETSQGKLIRELKGHGHWVNSLALSTEYVLRSGAFDHTGKQYSSPEEMKKVALDRYNKMKGSALERLVSGSDDFTMFLWEPAVSKHPKTRMTGHQQLVNHVYFSPDGQWIASASFDKSVKLWNGITGKFVAAFRGHVGPVYQISWSADSRLLLSGSKDSTLKVWDIRTQKLKQDLPGHADEVFAVDWSPDGEKVASGGKDKVLKLWMG